MRLSVSERHVASNRQAHGRPSNMKEQVAQVQKVSAQLEASKPAPQVVNNQ